MKQGSLGGGKDGEGREERGNVIGPSGEGIGLAIAGPFAIDDGVVVGRHGGCPSGVASGYRLGMVEVLQVLVVNVDLDKDCCTLT